MTTIGRSTDTTTITPTLVLGGWETEDEPQTIVTPILGSESVAVSLRPAAPSTGRLQLLFWDYASADAARIFHRAAAIFTTDRDLPWLPAAYVPNGPIRKVQQDSRARWVLEVPFVELQP